MRLAFAFALGVILLPPVCAAAGRAPLGDQKAKDSYSLGYEFGSNLRRQQVDIDPGVLLSAVQEGLDGKPSALGAQEIRDTLLALRKKVMVLQDRRYRELGAKNLEAGRAFLASNETKEGVQTLPGGLQYKVLKAGTGPSPKPTDTVTVNYRGTLIDGTEIDSSYRRGKPATVHVFGVMRGWTEALQHMKVGSKWRIFVPPELAYGDRPFGRVPPNAALIFEIELLSIGGETGPAAAESSPAGKAPAARPSS